MPEGVGGEFGVVGYAVPVSNLLWYCQSQGFDYNQRFDLFYRFFNTVAMRLGVSAHDPRAQSQPPPPSTADVFPSELFGTGPALSQYCAWATANAPREAPADFDPEKKRLPSTTRCVGEEQVMTFTVPFVIKEEEIWNRPN